MTMPAVADLLNINFSVRMSIAGSGTLLDVLAFARLIAIRHKESLARGFNLRIQHGRQRPATLADVNQQVFQRKNAASSGRTASYRRNRTRINMYNQNVVTPNATIILPTEGFIRLTQIIGDPTAEPPIPAVIPVSKSSWWAGVKAGKYPQSVKLGPRTTAWKVSEIRALIAAA